MMYFLFVTIPRLLFEPIAVGSLLGIIVALSACRKKHNCFYWVIAGSLFFMIVWRMIAYPRMLSARYSSALLYPAAILTVWFCFQLKSISQWIITAVFPRLNGPVSIKICSMIPALFIAGLAIASLIKTLHYDPYAKHIVNMCNMIKHEIDGKKYLFYTEYERRRISYYAGIQWDDIHLMSTRKLLKKYLDHAENDYRNLYFVFSLQKGEAAPDAESLNLSPEKGKWECIHSEYTSRRKNKKIMFYRFTPLCPNIEEWSGPIPELPEDNLIKNGGFEDVLMGDMLEKKLQNYVKKGFLSYDDPSRMIPEDWSFSLGSDFKNPPDLHLSAENVLAGRHSLSADTQNSKSSFSLSSVPIKRQDKDLQFSFFVRNDGKSGSTIRLVVYAWQPDKKKNYCIKNITLIMETGKTYRVHGTILKEQIPANVNNCYFNISAKGKYIFDQFSVTAGKSNE